MHQLKAFKKISPALLNVVDEFSRKIFFNAPMVNHRTGNKYLAQKPTGPIYASYYKDVQNLPKGFRAISPKFQTDVERRRSRQLKFLKKYGLGPPKKGAGKRKSKGKK
jgi:hypothetical protein